MAARPRIALRRVYDDRHAGEHRVLVDRLWPRGVSKAAAALDEWVADAAPSTELRRWYGHEVDRYEEFARRYRDELARPPASAAVEHLAELAAERRLTLLTATKDVEHSAARVLRDVLGLSAPDRG